MPLCYLFVFSFYISISFFSSTCKLFSNRWFILSKLMKFLFKINQMFLKIDDFFQFGWSFFKSMSYFQFGEFWKQEWWTSFKSDELLSVQWFFFQIWWIFFQNQWSFFKLVNILLIRMNIFPNYLTFTKFMYFWKIICYDFPL